MSVLVNIIKHGYHGWGSLPQTEWPLRNSARWDPSFPVISSTYLLHRCCPHHMPTVQVGDQLLSHLPGSDLGIMQNLWHLLQETLSQGRTHLVLEVNKQGLVLGTNQDWSSLWIKWQKIDCLLSIFSPAITIDKMSHTICRVKIKLIINDIRHVRYSDPSWIVYSP